MSEAKDTIYIDVDDEITTIIDKVQGAKNRIVALVLPKRAAVLQSMVNMKLLKKTAERADKRLVLITSESRLLPLAGAAGVHVAKNLQSAPEIPDVPDVAQPNEEVIDATPVETEPEQSNGSEKSSSSSESSKSTSKSESKPKNQKAAETEETIDVGDEDEEAKAEITPKKTKQSKKNKVPNFEKFRKRLIIGALVFGALIAVWVVAALMLPKGKVVIETDTTTVGSSFDFTADPNATEVNVPQRIVPAKQETIQKSDKQTVPATGKKNVGDKATGSIAMSSQICNSIAPPSSLPSGTVITANSQKYVTQQDVDFAFKNISGGCINYSSNGTKVVAQDPGTAANTGATTFTVPNRADITAAGSAGGGTDKTATVVTQSDINTAKQKLSNNDQAAKDELTKKLQDGGYYPMPDTFSGSKNAKITTSANVDDQAEQVTVTSETTYTMVGVKQDDLQKIVDDNVKSNIDPEKQKIQDYGLDKATFKIASADSNGKTTISLEDEVVVGPNINQDQLKVDLAGKKKGEAETIIKNLPGVKNATVSYSPFWVTKMPKPSRVTIIVEKAN